MTCEACTAKDNQIEFLQKDVEFLRVLIRDLSIPAVQTQTFVPKYTNDMGEMVDVIDTKPQVKTEEVEKIESDFS
jgi:hypothetical protein